MGAAISYLVSLEAVGPCPSCGVPSAVPDNLLKAKRENGGNLYCPNGHAYHYGDGENDKLRKQLEAEKKRVETISAQKKWAEEREATARKAEAIARGKLKATKERVGNGVCPCCNRTFQNLMRHMSTKHPHFKDEAAT